MPAKKKAVSFKLVQRPYDDPEYDVNKASIWMPTEEFLKNDRKGPIQRGSRCFKEEEDDVYKLENYDNKDIEDIDGVGKNTEYFLESIMKKTPEDFSNKRNMLEDDDTKEGDVDVFDEAEETDFENEFIQQMIYGDPADEDEDDKRLARLDEDENIKKKNNEDDDNDDDQDTNEIYHHHEATRVIDKQFDKMMNEFNIDEEINDYEKQDMRTQGPLTIEQYAPVLEEFVDANAIYSMMDDDAPLKHRGLLNGIRAMARENRVFDSDKHGDFVFSVLSDKATRQRAALRMDIGETAATTLHLVAEQEEAKKKGLIKEEGDTIMEIKVKPRERLDCESVLTTYSTLYNYPNVISVPKKVLKIQQQSQQELKVQMGNGILNKELTENYDNSNNNSNEDDDEDEEDENVQEVTLDISSRPAKETPEEKRMRRQLIKELQRDKRQQKKKLGNAFKRANIAYTQKANTVKQQKAQSSFSRESAVKIK